MVHIDTEMFDKHKWSIKIHCSIEFKTEKDMRAAEKKIHRTLAHKRKKGEWFDILPEDAKLELEHLQMFF